MRSSSEESAKSLKSGLIKFAIIDMLGVIMIGLGFYGKFIAKGNAFHPLLNDSQVVFALIAVGAVLMSWAGYKLMALNLKKSKLKNNGRV